MPEPLLSESLVPLMLGIIGILVILVFTAPFWLRAVNEVTSRVVGKVVVICPYCGIPGVVESEDPQVIR